MNLLWKSTLNFSDLQDFKFMRKVVKIAMDVWLKNRRKESVYKKKDVFGPGPSGPHPG